MAAESDAGQRGDELQLGIRDCQRSAPAKNDALTTSNVNSARISNLVLQNEFLNAFAGVDLPGVEIALRVGHDLVPPVKLAAGSAVVPRLARARSMFASSWPTH